MPYSLQEMPARRPGEGLEAPQNMPKRDTDKIYSEGLRKEVLERGPPADPTPLITNIHSLTNR